jgi:hypothetical protein
MASPQLQIDGIRHSFPESRSARLLEHLSRQSPLSGITPASRLEVRPAPEMASSGIAQLDALTGGLPRGCLTELCGPESSGHTTVMLSALAAATRRREEICALIDASDAFDPLSAAAASLDLERLLWVRCGSPAMSRKRRPAASLQEWQQRRMEDPVEQTLRAADLLLQSKGFGMVVLDLAGVPVKMARRIPLATWFRFRRAVENTPTILLVIGLQPCAESCASLSIGLRNSRRSPAVSQKFSVFSSQFSVPSSQFSLSRAVSHQLSAISQMGRARLQSCQSDPKKMRALAPEVIFPQHEMASSEKSFHNEPDASSARKPSHAELLTGMDIEAEVQRSRGERKTVQSVSAFTTRTAWTA